MDSQMVGKPTLMAIYTGRLEAATVLDSLGRVGYPLNDVSVYYRLKDTDQVLDATTGQVAAGQSLSNTDLTDELRRNVDTVVLLHPDRRASANVLTVLNSLGQPDVLYEGETDVEGAPGGYERQERNG